MKTIIGIKFMLWFMLSSFILGANYSKIGTKIDFYAKNSTNSFRSILDVVPGQEERRENLPQGWSLSTPDGSAKLVWSKHPGADSADDVVMELDATPFVKAGLDVNSLPKNVIFYQNKLLVGRKLAKDSKKSGGEDTAIASYERLLRACRESGDIHVTGECALRNAEVGRQSTLGRYVAGETRKKDHYGINLGDGNIFEWGGNTRKEQEDFAFVLNPEPFIRAGIDPERIEGWSYAKIPVEMDGKLIKADRLLKQVNIK